MRLVIPLIFSLASTAWGQTTLHLEGPDNAHPVELKQAAKALHKRCLDYGYEGVVSKLIYRGKERIIQVSCRTGLTSEMKDSIIRLASVAGNDLCFRQKYEISNAEKEQFKPGESAPKGTMWYPYMGEEGTPKDRFELYYKIEIGGLSDFNFSKIERGTISTEFFKDSRPFIRLSYPLSTRLKKYLSNQKGDSLTFFIDGMIPGKEWDLQFDGGQIHYWYCTKKSDTHSDCKKNDHPYYRKAYWFFSFDPKHLGPIVKNPMPFRLTPPE